jgi:phosphomethylpyrimidine synthase
MKITQEVRDLAPKQNASADTFLAATPSPLEGEGDSLANGVRASLGEAEAEAGMAEMSENSERRAVKSTYRLEVDTLRR